MRRVLIVHNWHRTGFISGENRTVEGDTMLLREAGIDVETFSRSNDELAGFGALRWAGMAIRPTVSPADARALRRRIRQFRPELVHLHNPMPLLSPWVIRTAHAARVPVVQTVNNYLHVCISGNYFRDGHPCHDCQGRAVAWPGALHGCYHGSRAQSAPLALSLTIHRTTWRLVDRFLAVGRAIARHLEQAGIDPDRITIRGNPVADPGPASSPGKEYALFVGRLSSEKGAQLLVSGWERSGLGSHRRLLLAGDGPDRTSIEQIARRVPGVELLGTVPHERALELIAGSAFVVVPSLWEEPFGLAVVEAMARGRAVLATNLGEPAEIVDSETGWLVEPTVDGFAAGLRSAFEAPLDVMGAAARRSYVDRFSPRASLRSLLDAYARCLDASRRSGLRSP